MPQTLNSTLRLSGTTQNVAIGASSAPITNGFAATTSDIRVVATSNCWISIGAAPTATNGAGSTYLPANVVEYFHVTGGQKVAVIQDSASGTLSVSEMTR